jgi:hypothetical protein
MLTDLAKSSACDILGREARPKARLALSTTAMGGLAIPIAQAQRFADRLEAWGAASLFAGSIFSLSIALPPSVVPWHAALVRF